MALERAAARNAALVAVLVLGAGCSHIFGKYAPIVDHDYVAIENPADTFVIVGIRLAKVDSRLTAANLMLYVNGDQQPPKGVVAPGVYSQRVQITGAPTYSDRLTYTETDPGGRAFRIWRLPAHYLARGAPARVFVFVQCVRDDAVPLYFSHGDVPLPIDALDRGWWTFNAAFNGLAIEIFVPGVYYVGDVEVGGEIHLDPSLPVRNGIFIETTWTYDTKLRTRIATDPPAAHYAFMQQSGMIAFPYFDFSHAWRRLPGTEFENFLRGNNSPMRWISAYLPPPAAAAPGSGR